MITLATIKQYVASVVDPLRTRVNGLVRRGTLTKLDNAGGLAAASARLTGDDDIGDEIEVLSPVGISSRPGKGAELLVFAVGGNPRVRVAIPFVRGQRLTGGDLNEDELALYVGTEGQTVHLKKDGSVLVSGKKVGGGDGGSIVLKANGDIVAVPSAAGKLLLGDGAATKKLALADEVDARFADIQTKFDAHNHPTAPVGPVSPPSVLIVALAPTGATNVYGKG